MNKITPLLFFFVFLLACHDKEKKQQQSVDPKVVEAKGYIVPKDSMAEPKVIVINESELKKIPVGKPIIVPTNLNVHPVGAPKIVPVGNPKIITPGTDTFSLPKVVPAIAKSIIGKQPVPIPALPFRMKDGATCNIQYLDVDQGMNSSYVKSIIEDKSGNLWFGTHGGGVSKYDGTSFTHYTSKEGLSNNIVWSILEDKRGNLWFGTNGGGVSKYDGTSFTHYTSKEGLSNNIVWSILEDKGGNLWFGTYGGGVIKYDGNSFTHYTSKEGCNDTIRSILEDKSGNFWFGTYSGGVIKYDGNSFKHYTTKEGLSNKTVFSMLEDKSGNLWFGTYGGGVSKYDGKSFKHYTTKEGLSNNIVMSIIEDKSGNLWFGTYGGGVSKYDGNRVEAIERGDKNAQRTQQDLKKINGNLVRSFTHYTTKEGLSNNIVRSILEDKSGNLWFGTDGGGVSKYDETSFTHYTTKEGLSSNTVLSILEDKSGNLWLGTVGGGVSKYDGRSFTHYTAKEGLSNNTVWSILEDKSGNLWFATHGGGVCKYDGRSFTHYTTKEGLSNNTVLSIIEDKSGNLWFGTDGGGVSKYDGNRVEAIERGDKNAQRTQQDLKKINDKLVKSFTHYTTKEGLSENTVLSIIEDKRGNLWFGTDGGGVCKYDGNSFTHYTTKEGLSNNIVWSIIEDKSGNLWFGTDGGGVSKYDGNRVEAIERGDKIAQRTQQDLKKINGKLVKSFTHYTTKEGLSNNIVWSIIEDKSENLWLSTEKGLSCFPALGLKENKQGINSKIMVFHKEDGLKAEDFLQNAVLLDSKNHIWWGSGKALTMFDLNKFKLNEKEPEVQLENIYIQENFVDYRSINSEINDSITTNENEELKKIKFNGVADFHNYPKDLELPYYLNHLTFQFSAIDWYAPHKIKYQYKLEGLDSDWNNLTADNKADYRNIPFGNYTFKVKAIGSANKWSKTFEYTFVVHPPWWRTWWAYVIYVLLGITTLILVVLWNGRRLIAKSIELKNKVDEATLEIKQQKHLIEEKHQEITDSVNYAERIQKNFLVTKDFLNTHLKTGFIVFKPKDKVSGDFYWAEKLSNNNIAVMVADSTGHGIPGAFMSLLNMSLLNEAVLSNHYTNTHDILNFVRTKLISTIKKDENGEGGNDGMDGCLFAINYNTLELQFTGANNSLWIIRNSELIELKGEKMPVGRSMKEDIAFTSHYFQLQKNDWLYASTDGYIDQFGGEKNRKFMSKQLKETLLQIHHLNEYEQQQQLETIFENWKGTNEQVDDVCLIGIRI